MLWFLYFLNSLPIPFHSSTPLIFLFMLFFFFCILYPFSLTSDWQSAHGLQKLPLITYCDAAAGTGATLLSLQPGSLWLQHGCLPLDWCLAWSHPMVLKQELQCLGSLQGLPADLSWDGLDVRLLWFMFLSYPERVSNFPFWYLLKNGGVLHHLPYFSLRDSLHQLVAV